MTLDTKLISETTPPPVMESLVPFGDQVLGRLGSSRRPDEAIPLLLADVVRHTGARGGVLLYALIQDGIRRDLDYVYAPDLDETRRRDLLHCAQHSEAAHGPDGLQLRSWRLNSGAGDLSGRLVLFWPPSTPAPTGDLLAGFIPALALQLLLAHRLVQAESARMTWLDQVRYHAILTESLEWLNELEHGLAEETDRNVLYKGLLDRARVIARSEKAALSLYRTDGSRYQWVSQGLEETEVQQLLNRRPSAARHFWDVHDVAGLDNLMELQIETSQGLRARLYLANKRHGDDPGTYDRNDEGFLLHLCTQVFRTLDKLELMEDLRLSNQFLAMERKDQEKLIRELKDTQQQLLHSEKLASIGQLAAGVAHEINNPVSFVSSNLFHLRQEFDQLARVIDRYQTDAKERPLLAEEDWHDLRQEISEVLQESRDGIERVRQIVLDLRNFSRQEESGWQLIDLHQCIDSTLNIVRNETKYKAEIIRDYGELPLIQCNPGQISQVIMNLVVNAAQAIPDRGEIRIRTGHRGDEIYFAVSDNGAGIKAEHRNRIFDPFFTTKPVGKGTGLGLSLVYGIATSHRGRIELESELGKGTTFTVWLPINQPDEDSDSD